MALLLGSCLTYYQQLYQFHKNYETGNFEGAQKALTKDDKAAKGKAKLLYNLNMGMVNHMLQNYEQSNQYFEQAYLLSEDYRKNYLNEVLSYLTNPTVIQYPGEDFEILYLHYYKALNFLMLQQADKALVECRRLNLKLQAISDKYKSDKKFQRDAFVHTLMGMVYEVNGDINNAFIAYRNALDIYQNDYKELFGLNVPEQLKKDVIRTAFLMGFDEEQRRYEKEFEMQHQKDAPGSGSLFFIWHNGLGPVKTEWSVNFAITRRGSEVFFVNDRLGLNFPFPLSLDDDDKDPLGGLSVVRVAFPKYRSRGNYFRSARLNWGSEAQDLEILEDIDAVARKTLKDRMVLTFGKTLLRFAIKRASEEILRKENKEGLATLLSIINAATEKADTRGWQVIPNRIYYTRLAMPAGSQSLNLEANSAQGARTFDFQFDIASGQAQIHTFHTMEIDPSLQTNAPEFYSY